MAGSSPLRPVHLDPEAMSARLAGFAAGQLGVPPETVRIEGLRRLAGGSSRETWAFSLITQADAEHEPERRELVLRRDPPGRVGEGERTVEFRVVQAAGAAGVRVPRVYWCCGDPQVLETPFYVMDHVAGEALPRRLLREPKFAEARRRLPAQLAAEAARIHAVDPANPALAGLEAPPPGSSPARVEVERLATAARALSPEPHPVLELAERWLLARLPTATRCALVHGDFRLGNVLCDEQGVTAVLDWELCKIGDPVEDLGWLCTRAWRFGNDALPVAGLAERETLLAAYREASGREVEADHLRFWEAVGSFKVALVFIQQASVHLDGRLRSVELAALGRRTVEAERELVRLMEEA
jgi:aminoglycoside phosphotransferase (APT) family kinase protein